jgi:ABC-type glycerol-3-phosphate transport system permease component
MGWGISSSFKPLGDIFIFPVEWIPKNFTLENYTEGWTAGNFTRYFINSMFVSVTCTVSILFFSSLTGFSLTSYRFPGRKLIFVVVIATMVIPIQVRVIPLYIIIQRFGWLNSYFALIMPLLITPIGIFIMTQFIRAIPKELFCVARIDGCSEFGIFIRIVLPLCKPALSALAIITFMNVWNDYFWPLVAISDERLMTLPLGLATFQDHYYIEYGKLFALSFVVILPVLAVFIAFQKHFIRSVALSGMKA